MRISEFCNTFQISHQAVYAKIQKYAAELDGHISKDKGNVTDLDPFAVNLLKPKKASYGYGGLYQLFKRYGSRRTFERV